MDVLRLSKPILPTPFFISKAAMPLGQHCCIISPGARDAWLGTENWDCQLALALWQGASVALRADVPACR